MTDDFQPYSDLLPDGALPISGFRVIRYVNPSGEQQVLWSRAGEGYSVSLLVGDIEVAQWELLYRVESGEEPLVGEGE